MGSSEALPTDGEVKFSQPGLRTLDSHNVKCSQVLKAKGVEVWSYFHQVLLFQLLRARQALQPCIHTNQRAMRKYNRSSNSTPSILDVQKSSVKKDYPGYNTEGLHR
jgi:hypothetical protein